MINIWHDINPKKITPDSFYAVIEIGKGSKIKYELDKDTGFIKMDRILHTSTHYPANYGLIPRTYSDDNDPLDVLVLCSEALHPLTLVRCYPIGAISMKPPGTSPAITQVPGVRISAKSRPEAIHSATLSTLRSPMPYISTSAPLSTSMELRTRSSQ